VQTEVGDNAGHRTRINTGEKLDEGRHVRTESREIRKCIEKSSVRWKTIQPNSHLIDQAENSVEFGSMGVVRVQCFQLDIQADKETVEVRFRELAVPGDHGHN